MFLSVSAIPEKAYLRYNNIIKNINDAFLEGVSTAEPHGTPETSTTRSVGHDLFRERGPEKYHPSRKRSG